jgi:hypothetical protein
MRTNFPSIRTVGAACRSAVTGKPTILPPVAVPWGTIGHALDYRLRYYFGVTPNEELVAYSGMMRVSEGSSGDRFVKTLDELMTEPRWPNLGRTFFESLTLTLDRIDPVRRRLAIEGERALNLHCVVLAFFEQIYRTGDVATTPLIQLDTHATAEDALALVPSPWIDDLCELSYAFYDAHAQLAALPAVLNPTFAGSHHVGGADADLIVGNCLIEVKTTKNPALRTRDLYQLIGYTLLDYENQFHIRDVGFYLSRQATMVQWTVDQLLAMTSGGKSRTLAQWRSSFRAELGHSTDLQE